MAEGVLKQMAAEAGMWGAFYIDSAGLEFWNVGLRPARRAIQAAAGRGVDISGLRGRPLNAHDYSEFDLLLAMDWQNLREIERRRPFNGFVRVRLLAEYAGAGAAAVPDPYFRRAEHFETVLNQIEDAARGVLFTHGPAQPKRLTRD